jgi:hypothetical protein
VRATRVRRQQQPRAQRCADSEIATYRARSWRVSARLTSPAATTFADGPSSEAIQALTRKLLEQNEFAGRDELLAQVNGIEHVDGPVTMMRVRIRGTYPASNGVPSPVPSNPQVLDESGDVIGGMILWLDDESYMDCLEYWWVTDEMPTELPPPDCLVAS